MHQDLTMLTDEELMGLVQSADQAALRILYDRHAAALTAHVGHTLSDPVEAADIVHETFLSVWEGAAKFRESLSLRAWLYTIARNKAVDRLRKSSRQVLRDPDPNIADIDPDPEQIAMAGEDKHRVRACLEKLSATHRNVISLAFFEGMSYREISAIEDVSEGTIKSRIFHAKKLLMHCLNRSVA